MFEVFPGPSKNHIWTSKNSIGCKMKVSTGINETTETNGKHIQSKRGENEKLQN